MKGTYIFEFDISGRATISVEASSEDEAVKLLKTDYDLESELSEWNIDYPNFFEEMDTEDMMKYCASKPKVK